MGMYKLLKYSALNKNGEPGSDIIRPREFRSKMASFKMLPEMADFWRTQDPDPDKYLYLLVNIMGASEWWGLNLNGDGFTESTLKKYHKTFMQGHAYWLHDNDDVEKSFGKNIFASYNDDMHRVEILQRLERSNPYTQKIEHKMMLNIFPSVSMGCHVPFDVCLICQNRAKTKKDYCLHVLRHMRQLWPIGDSDGRRCGVDNPHATFFDGSFVEVEADPQSGVLAKVAFVDDRPYVLSVDAAVSYFSKEAAAKTSEDKDGEMDKPLDPTDAEHKYTPQVDFNDEARELATVLDESDAALDKEALDKLSYYPSNSVVHTAAIMGISIRPEEYGYMRAKQAGLEGLGTALLKHRVDRVKIGSPTSVSRNVSFDREIAGFLSPSISSRSYFPSSFEGRVEKVASDKMSMPSGWMDDYVIAVKEAMSVIGSDPSIFYKTAWVNAFVKTACKGKYCSEEEWQGEPRKEASIVVEMLNGAFRIGK